MVSQYHFFNFMWILANQESKETTRLCQGYRNSPGFLWGHWYPSILTPILKTGRKKKCSALQCNSACLVQVCCSLFILPLMIKSTLTVGQAELKHRKAASNLTQCFPNSETCWDLLSVLIVSTKGRLYIQNQKHEFLISWETFLSLFGALHTAL